MLESLLCDWIKQWLTPSLSTVIIVIFILIAVCYIWKWIKEYQMKQHRNRVDRQCEMIDKEDTIFVSIASYRDSQCAETIFDLFEKAYCPFRITVGVCQQNYDNLDHDILLSYKLLSKGSNGLRDFSDRIRIIRMNADEATGPMYARHLIETQLYKGEKFYLITDSHMLWTQDWDKKLISEWNICKTMSPKPILTTYPDDFKPHHRVFPPSDFENRNGTFLRFKKFNEKTGLVEIEGSQMVRRPKQPLLSLFWAGCLSFGLASMIQEVPFDPNCPYVFFGEEISMAARLWTHGYDLYHPTSMIVYHMWERKRPTFWQQFNDKSDETHKKRREIESQSYERMYKLFGIGESGSASTLLPPYGLGKARSLSQYETFIGIKLDKSSFLSLSGLMGLPNGADSQDVLCRYGSWSQFNRWKEQLLKQLKP